jgi:hypothetical protein
LFSDWEEITGSAGISVVSTIISVMVDESGKVLVRVLVLVDVVFLLGTVWMVWPPLLGAV